MSHNSKQQKKHLQPKFVTARDASLIYGVHRDYFRKNPELRRYRRVLNKHTHLYPLDKLDAYFDSKRVD